MKSENNNAKEETTLPKVIKNRTKQIHTINTKKEYIGKKLWRNSHCLITFTLVTAYCLVPISCNYTFEWINCSSFEAGTIISLIGVLTTSCAAIVPFVILRKQMEQNIAQQINATNLELFSKRTEILTSIYNQETELQSEKYESFFTETKFLFDSDILSELSLCNKLHEEYLENKRILDVWLCILEINISAKDLTIDSIKKKGITPLVLIRNFLEKPLSGMEDMVYTKTDELETIYKFYDNRTGESPCKIIFRESHEKFLKSKIDYQQQRQTLCKSIEDYIAASLEFKDVNKNKGDTT